jgi:hypothetical protein
MYASMARNLHLHHSNPLAKLQGLPGDQLAHGKCNIADGGKRGAAITNGAAVVPIKSAIRHSRVW